MRCRHDMVEDNCGMCRTGPLDRAHALAMKMGVRVETKLVRYVTQDGSDECDAELVTWFDRRTGGAFVDHVELRVTVHAKPRRVAYALLHELGHVGQVKDGLMTLQTYEGSYVQDRTGDPVGCTELGVALEADAWHRAEVLAEIALIPVDSQFYDSVAESLGTYVDTCVDYGLVERAKVAKNLAYRG